MSGTDTSRAAGTDWRRAKRERTRRLLQQNAMRLFLEKGFDATTVEEIAAASGVSHMTFFRYFPTKEDAALEDDYDPMIADLIAERPAEEPAIDKIRHALTHGLNQLYDSERDVLLARMRLVYRTPALRAGTGQRRDADQRLLIAALAPTAGGSRGELHLRVVVAAALAAVTEAIRYWAESNGADDLRHLIDEAFDALRAELTYDEPADRPSD
ncbi:TetR family transcriptional regulator [Micromonospora sp. NPDC049274]|uniref:acyl-CoA-like ligand-binding transcription factor n=1 Tax=Micromonospora sp. NPDC049274 TaxID=3154829 RepID=UPI00342A4720